MLLRVGDGAMLVDRRYGRVLRIDSIGGLVLDELMKSGPVGLAKMVADVMGAPVAQVRADVDKLLSTVHEWVNEDVARPLPFDGSDQRFGVDVSRPSGDSVASIVDSLDCPLEIRLFGDATGVGVPLLATLGSAQGPAEHVVEVWPATGRWAVALDGTNTMVGGSLDDAVAELVAIITTFAGLRHGDLKPNRVRVHASAVVMNSEAIVMCGRSDSSKTSTALRLMDAGAAYITDEVCELDLVSGVVRGLSRPLSLKGPIRDELPHRRPAWQTPTDPRWLVAASDLGPTAGTAPVAAVVLLEQTGESPPLVTPLSGLDAVLAIISMMFRHDACDDEMLRRIEDFVDRVAVMRIRHDGSVSASQAILDRFGSTPGP